MTPSAVARPTPQVIKIQFASEFIYNKVRPLSASTDLDLEPVGSLCKGRVAWDRT